MGTKLDKIFNVDKKKRMTVKSFVYAKNKTIFFSYCRITEGVSKK